MTRAGQSAIEAMWIEKDILEGKGKEVLRNLCLLWVLLMISLEGECGLGGLASCVAC